MVLKKDSHVKLSAAKHLARVEILRYAQDDISEGSLAGCTLGPIMEFTQ